MCFNTPKMTLPDAPPPAAPIPNMTISKVSLPKKATKPKTKGAAVSEFPQLPANVSYMPNMMIQQRTM